MTTIEINLSRNKCSWKLGNIFCTTQLNPPERQCGPANRWPTQRNFGQPGWVESLPRGKVYKLWCCFFFAILRGWLFQNRWLRLPSPPQRSKLCFWDSAKLSSLTYDVGDSIWPRGGWVTWREVKGCHRNSVSSNLWLTGKFKGVT